MYIVVVIFNLLLKVQKVLTEFSGSLVLVFVWAANVQLLSSFLYFLARNVLLVFS